MAIIRNERDESQFACEDGDTILRAALRSGIGMPYSCNTGSCGNCRFELIEGEVRHLRADAPAWGERDRARNRWLGCQSTPKTDCRVKFRSMDDYVPKIRPTRRPARLTDVEKITHDISEFTLEVDGDPDFLPGQYALLYIPGVDAPRAYSMSSIPSDGHWRFLVKKAPGGAATGWLFEAEAGGRIDIDGPYGTASLRVDRPRDIVLLAGGSGLSPMVSIARGAVAAGMSETRKIALFYGGRDLPDLFDPIHLGPARAHVDFTAALSEPASDWSGATGFLHDVVADRMGETLKECEVYFAGPAAMSVAVQKMAHEHEVPMGQLHFDEFY